MPPIYSALSPMSVNLWDSGVYLRPGGKLWLSDCAEQAQLARRIYKRIYIIYEMTIATPVLNYFPNFHEMHFITSNAL